MREPTPVTGLCPDFSSAGAAPVPWGRARTVLADAPLYWVTTVRPDGRPHTVPLLGVWVDGSVCFCPGREGGKGPSRGGKGPWSRRGGTAGPTPAGSPGSFR
ncbi:pyridoxamine 5'-phosphate oxidase family protein [Nocardiopsis sp. YSL2]|uniref:pyridoxamine 5'-phosphate oxidase family protein n=1 Tax=Nocardiopsis sp. YSL2 TaxID=2939492 RepID=UPI0026F4375D|nr:pyridoxamine 5'-phosphate oxidase family protein [Nocardiopsis sp. YSL2]